MIQECPRAFHNTHPAKGDYGDLSGVLFENCVLCLLCVFRVSTSLRLCGACLTFVPAQQEA